MVKMSVAGEIAGTPVHEALLENDAVAVRLLSYGAITRDWRVRGLPCVMGFQDVAVYDGGSMSAGIIAGRVANRTAGGKIVVDGRTYQLDQNEGENHLHGGGPTGLGRRHWAMEPVSGTSVRLSYHSPDGEAGYPGALDIAVVVTLEDHMLTYDMTAHADRKTPVNLAQHSYYNLGGAATIRDHQIKIAADRYTPVREDLIPTGEILSVEGTRFDFRQTSTLAKNDPERAGVDINLALQTGRDTAAPAIEMMSPASGLTLKLWTEEPGVQMYDGFRIAIPEDGWWGKTHGPYSGVCFEPQTFPNAINAPDFTARFATPENPYRQTLKVEIR